MYLRGDFGKEANSVNAYVASTLYAIDRFASYRQDWQRFYEEGGIIIADRYTTSNMVHQMIKYNDKEERNTFLQWLDHLEYDLYGLPRPDAVILLDMPLSLSKSLLAERTGKTGGNTGDIHEQDTSHLTAVHEAYDMLVNGIACIARMKVISYVLLMTFMRKCMALPNNIYVKASP